MEHKLFSELITRIKVKPDFILAEKIDDIDIPFRNIKAIKKDINNLFLTMFSDFMVEYNNASKEFKNFEVQYDSSMSMFVKFEKRYELNLKKVKKECSNSISPIKITFDDKVLTDDFIKEIDRVHIVMSLITGLAFRKTISHLENGIGIEMMQPKIIYNQIFEFWTKYYKDDFCYLSRVELESKMKFEELEIEFCFLKFFFNAYLKVFMDFAPYAGDQRKIIKGIVDDMSNYRWYVIFGFWLVKRLEEKHINAFDMISFDYKKIEEILQESLN